MDTKGTTSDVPPRAEPCPHMANWVSAFSDGTLRGLPRWLTRLHLFSCPRCSQAVRALSEMRAALLRLGRQPAPTERNELSAERTATLQASLDAIDRGERPPKGRCGCGE